jgi:hypothetical protein
MSMHIRWSDEDRYFGPFTYARDSRGYRPLALEIDSGDGDDYPGCRLRLSGFGHTLIMALPPVIKPWRRWVDTSHYEWSKSPNGGYWDTHRQVYGVSINEGHLSLHYGPQTHDSSTSKQRGYFLPWTQWRHVRRSFYGLTGEHVATLLDTGKSYLADPGRWERERAIEDAVPIATFAFIDFDGEPLTVATRIEEREWRFGTGWFKWLSLFRRAKVVRSLDLQFSGETGKRKGSWKGGTVGHSIEMLPGELHEAAFRRYCAQHNMTFANELVLPV